MLNTTTLTSVDGTLEVDPKKFNWPIDTSGPDVHLDVAIEWLEQPTAEDASIQVGVTDEGLLIFEALPAGGSFSVTFPFADPTKLVMVESGGSKTRSMRLKDKNKQRAKAKISNQSKRRNRE